ncbi:MAG: ATP-binding protein [bacterium]
MPLKGLSDYVLSIVEDRDGSLWIGARKGVYRLTPPVAPVDPQMKSTVHVVHFDSTAGMSEKPVKMASIGGRMHFITRMGLRRYLSQQRRFIPDSSFGAAFAEPSCVLTHLIEDCRGRVSLAGQLNGTPFCHSADFPHEGIPAFRLEEIGALLAIYPDAEGVIWLGGTDGIIRYDPAVSEEPLAPFYALIREVDAGDSLIFAGAIGPAASRLVPVLPYAANSLRFQFAATDYRSPASLRYRHQLEGFDRGWSAWSVETFPDYTGLPPGEYRFRVQAQNGLGAFSREASFPYRILPPWYRTGWAYLLYGLMMVAFVAGIVKWRVWQLQKEARRLEALIADRTRTIQQQSDKLAELDRIKSRFFANISHEFRTPLTLILGPLEDWLAQARDLARKAEWLRMRRAARRLLRLINQLLDLSRLEAGQLTLRAAPGDFPAFLKCVTMSFASLAEQKRIHLHFDGELAADALREMYFDREKMETIISNLLANALKFTPKDGEVKVSVHSISASILAAKTEECVEVKISDTGPGIPPDQLPHIFGRFYQGNNRAASAQSGVGIGLALVKELVELHHGEVLVESVEGKGTAFALRFPVGWEAFHAEELREEMPDKSIEPAWEDELDEEAAPVVSARQKSVSPGEKPVILLVEDHADVRRYISGQLLESFQIVEAEEGESGWHAALEIVPDLVLSDVMMPGIDGGKLCEKLKSDPRTSHIPVVLLTARAGEEDRLAGLEIGADDYLTKPFNSRELQIRVRNLIEQRRKLRDIYRREGLLQTAAPPMPSAEQAFIRQLMSVVDAKIEAEGFGPEEMSHALHMSRRQLQRKIHALTGQSPAEFIRTVRLRHARQLLAQRAGTVSEIAYRVGFNNLSYFARSFKKEFGVNPSQFLQSSE